MKRTGTLLLGLFLGVVFSQAHLAVRAAPADVLGSPNVAVDTYRNAKGTFVLWSNGRVTDAASGNEVCTGAADYTDPVGAAHIGAPPHPAANKPLGAPNLAVKAVPRPDATYVLFSDGKLRTPPNSAGAPALGNRVLSAIKDRSGGISYIGPGITSSNSGSGITLTFDPPFSSKPIVLLQSVGIIGVKASDGTNFGLVSPNDWVFCHDDWFSSDQVSSVTIPNMGGGWCAIAIGQ